MATEQATMIAVQFGRLIEPLRTYKVRQGSTLGQFLQRRKLKYNASIRINANIANEETPLNEGDIITAINEVSGG